MPETSSSAGVAPVPGNVTNRRRHSRFALPHAKLSQFNFVLGTGTTSTALHNVGAYALSDVLFVLAIGGYCALTACVAVRWARDPRVVLADVRESWFGGFAFPAGAGVIAARSTLLDVEWPALTFTAVAAVTWVLLVYCAIAAGVGDDARRHSAMTDADAETGPAGRPWRPDGLMRVDGSWFVLVVSSQSVAVAAGATAAAFHHPRLAELAAICWSVGVVQLAAMIALGAARLLLAPLRSVDDVAPFWVFMGACMISVLGGSEVLAAAGQQSFVDDAVLTSVCAVLWSFGSWLVPLLIVMMLWDWRREDTYSGFRTSLWSMVFPIGMWGEASRELGEVRRIDWLIELGTAEAWVVFTVWCAVFAGMLGWWWRWWTGRELRPSPADVDAHRQ